MKDKLILNKVILSISLVIFILILFLILLGNISRKGYLSEFQLNESLSTQGNYLYSFRIKYYSKIFRNSDIYGVYTDTNKIIQDNNFIKEIKFDYKGSPFGILTSTKELIYDEKIDDIDYKLTIKLPMLVLFIISFMYLSINIVIMKNRKKLSLEYLKKIKFIFIKYKKAILIFYSALVILFILFVIINSNIKHTSKLTNLELIAESRLGYVYRGKIDLKDNFLFSIDNNSIKLNNTNDIKYYGYSLEITNKPLGSWHSTNISYTANNTFIISNESTNVNPYYYNIQVPTYVGDKYKITILAKQLPEIGNIAWHLNSSNNFKEITTKEVSNDYIVLTDTREVTNPADGNLDLHLIIPQGVTEIESILIESLNNNLNIENAYTIFTSGKKIDILKLQYSVKLTNISQYFITILIFICLLILFITYRKYLRFKYIKLFLYDIKFQKIRKYMFICYSIIVIFFILFVIINSNTKYTSKLTNLELISESRLGYVYRGKIDLKDSKLFSIDNNSIKLGNTNDIKYYGYSLEITNKPLGSWHSTNISYTANNTFIISNESTNENAYYYNIQVPTYVGDKYKITILAKQIPEDGIIKWHLNGHNWFKEITQKEISNNYIILTDIREVTNPADGNLDLHLIIPQGVTEIKSISIESLNKSLKSDNGYTIFTSKKEFNDLIIMYYYKYNDIFHLILLLSLSIVTIFLCKKIIYLYFNHVVSIVIFIFLSFFILLLLFINLSLYQKYLYLSIYLIIFYSLLGLFIIFKLKLNFNLKNILYVLIFNILYSISLNFNYFNSDNNTSKFLIFFIFSLILSTFFFIFYLYSEYREMKIEKIFLVSFIMIGLSYMLFLPYLEVPDESAHFFRAYEISQGHLISDKDNNKNGGRLFERNMAYIGAKMNSYSDLLSNISKPKIISDTKVFIAFPNTALYFFISYLPQSLGIRFGDLFNVNYLILAYLGRIFNFIFFVIAGYLSMKYIPVKKMSLYIIMFLPMTLQESISLAVDPIVISTSSLLIALCLNIKYRDEYITIKEIILLYILTIFISGSKITYLPICFIIFIIPKTKFKNNKFITILPIITVAILINIIWLKFSMYNYSNIKWSPDVNEKEQIHFVLNNIFEYCIIFINTITKYFFSYIRSMIGKDLSWFSISIPNISYYIFLYLLILILVFDNEVYINELKIKLVSFFIVTISIGLIFSALYASWTPVGNDVIFGVQGRYFLPILFYILILFSNRFTKLDFNLIKNYIFIILIMNNILVLNKIFITFYK